MQVNEKLPPLRVLLIEDDEDDYLIIRDLLREIPNRDFQLLWAPTFRRGRRAIMKGTHDLCLLDYGLGIHTGLDLLKEIDGKDIRIPIIFLTGLGRYEVDLQAMKWGASDYLVKDALNGPLFERTIRYAIERVESQKALQAARNELELRVQQKTAALADANAELRQVAEDIKFFAHSVAHDLKNPAISLYGLAKRLRNHYSADLDSKGHSYCLQIMRAAEEIASLTEKINVFLSAGEIPLDLEPVDLAEILNTIREEFSEQMLLRQIRWFEPSRSPVIRADRDSITRILRNLVENALKYGGDALQEIRIHTDESEQFHILSVSDDGIGIKRGDYKKIFGFFQRLGTYPEAEGSGLGLAIVKTLAERHGGKAWAETAPLPGANVMVSISKSL
jgi:signal transduction histidine kinase